MINGRGSGGNVVFGLVVIWKSCMKSREWKNVDTCILCIPYLLYKKNKEEESVKSNKRKGSASSSESSRSSSWGFSWTNLSFSSLLLFLKNKKKHERRRGRTWEFTFELSYAVWFWTSKYMAECVSSCDTKGSGQLLLLLLFPSSLHLFWLKKKSVFSLFTLCSSPLSSLPTACLYFIPSVCSCLAPFKMLRETVNNKHWG